MKFLRECLASIFYTRTLELEIAKQKERNFLEGDWVGRTSAPEAIFAEKVIFLDDP